MMKTSNKSVVATADNAASSLRSGRLLSAVPHFKRSAENMRADHIYREAGFTLAYIQFADKCIASALKLAFPGSATHTLETIERNKRVLAKATLGTLIRILSERVELHPDFEQELTTYCEDRNSFVHDWDRIKQWE